MIVLTQSEAKAWPIPNSRSVPQEAGVHVARVEMMIPDLKYELRAFAADVMTVLDERYFEPQKMIQFTEWNLGTEEFNQVGWKTCELMRRGYSENRSIEAASAHVFRFDESVEARAFLLQVFLNQWSATITPGTASFSISMDEERLWFKLQNLEIANYVMEKLKRWKPRVI